MAALEHLFFESVEQRRCQSGVGLRGVHDDYHPEFLEQWTQTRVRAHSQAAVAISIHRFYYCAQFTYLTPHLSRRAPFTRP